MKRIATLIACFALTVCAFSQTAPAPAAPASTLPANIYAGGISFNSSASPRVAGTGLYARLVDSSAGTYAFTVIDALPISTSPFTVNTNIGVGVAQKIFTIAKTPIFIPTSAGISWSGSNTGWAWSTGALVPVKIKNGWHIYPNVRVVKSSVSNNSGYQPIAGILIGWQK